MKVKCKVDSCTYWKNNLCHAPEIEVASQYAEVDPSESDETMCVTFKSDKR